jgi:CheY-like chemotaxis protein
MLRPTGSLAWIDHKYANSEGGVIRNLLTLYSKWDVCGEAVDGQQAIDAAVALRPDLVLLDYKMPRVAESEFGAFPRFLFVLLRITFNFNLTLL